MPTEIQTDPIAPSSAGVPRKKADAQALATFFAAFRQQASGASDEMASFFQKFAQDYRVARKDRAATTPHLDVLRVFGLEYAELRHSDVLAWFLRPTNEHEQGPLFANALLQHLGLEPISDENYFVLRERHERTDLAIYASGKFAIFIENKVRHTERDKQVSDMVHSMARVSQACRIPRDRRFAIFLTDSGAESVTGPDADSPEFLVSHLVAMRRVELFKCFRMALEGQPNHSPLLMNFINSYLNAVRRLRTQLS